MMNELYNQCDVFVSPTRAEAFNIPCIEAMACGKPVITTDFGGQTDFVNNKNGWLLGYKLNQVTHEIEYESCMWATPDIKDLRSKLRGCFENKDDCERKGLISLEDAKKYTWENTAKMVLNLSL